MTIHYRGKTTFSFTHIESIILSIREEVDEFAGGASGMGVDRVGEVCCRASKGQANKPGLGHGSDELTKVRRMIKGD